MLQVEQLLHWPTTLLPMLIAKHDWELNQKSNPSKICIQAVREDEVPGTHIIAWDSSVDRIQISHEAKSRKGFALGAVLAAEFIHR